MTTPAIAAINKLIKLLLFSEPPERRASINLLSFREERKEMDFEAVKKLLEKERGEDDKNATIIPNMPSRFFERFIMQGLRIDLIEPGRIICSMKVPSRLLVLSLSLSSYLPYRTQTH